MPTLDNQKHEVFVQKVVEGLSATKAYQAAYPNAAYYSAGVGGHKLLKQPRVRDRIVELRAEINTKAKSKLVAKVVVDLKDKEVRINKLSEMISKLENVMTCRANLYSKLPGSDYKIPGHKEGIVVPIMQNGKLKHEVDVALIREYRSTLQQIAEECGPERIRWNEDDGLKELAAALNASPTEPPQEPETTTVQ